MQTTEISQGSTQARKAYTPAEFAQMNGRHPCWGYRQVYAGNVKVVQYAGRILIPAQEVERFLANVGEYKPRKKKGAKA